ncbi:hypothetical protein GGX14DRAFT_538596 [Mycena pura]|uniref:Phosphoribosylaminoimidazole-succinocarboxamide synthase n=1 Tax=Mycena pura TaxID=153505 RepID=A0AAD7E489_9AGAR|nr:hypothetical protein GGX14DRAFT_538596 [Mycena pura]
MDALVHSDLPTLTLLSKGKVRDIYATSEPDKLLFVATDRISAYDVILKNGIPGKGQLLTEISLYWFHKLAHIIPNHLITTDIDAMPPEVHAYKAQLTGRAMLVRKAQVVALEAIVRGYLTGSAWAEYKKSGTVHGIHLPAGLVESQRLPRPLFTPSTKAEQGQHDENISPEKAAALVGEALYAKITTVALALYDAAAAHAHERGIILADTKFEFGLAPSDTGEQELIVIDELLTPDSSRYWPLEGYTAGKPQPSFDKQYLRDWLVGAGFRKGLEAGPEGSADGGSQVQTHILASLCLDFQVLYPPALVPTVLRELNDWYIRTSNDPLIKGVTSGHGLVWFKSFVYLELLTEDLRPDPRVRRFNSNDGIALSCDYNRDARTVARSAGARNCYHRPARAGHASLLLCAIFPPATVDDGGHGIPRARHRL